AATAVSSAAAHTLPSSSTRMICAFCSAGRVGSATARRSPCSRSSRSAIANRSSASVPKSAEPAALLNRSSTSASEVLLTPLIGRSPSPSRGPGPGRTPGRTLRSRHRSSADRPRVGRGGGLQLLEEPVDDAALPRLVLEGLADDAAGQLDGQPTDLRAELGEGGLAIRLDLGLRRLDDAASLGLGLLAELGLDLRALRLRLLADPGRLLPGLGELGAVLLERPLRLGLSLLGPLDAALDRLGALLQRLLDTRDEHLADDEEDDEEGEDADDELVGVRQDRVVLRREDRGCQWHRSSLPSVVVGRS